MTILDTVPTAVRARVRQCVADTRELAAVRLYRRPGGPAPPRRTLVRVVRAVNQAADAVERATDLVSLERAIGDMGVRTIELVSLFEHHTDPMARLLSVMRRAAPHVLGDDEAGPITRWAANLERGDSAAA